MRSLIAFLICAASGLAADVALSIGVGPSSASVSTPSGTFSGASSTATVLVDASKKIFGIGPASLALDAPLAFGGPTNAQVSVSSGAVAASASHLQFAFTPGVKARVGIPLLSPWASFGIGGARLQQAATLVSITGAPSQASNRWALALSPAAGIDVKPIPFIFFRGEVRSYVFRTPEQLLATGIDPFKGNWRSNLLFLAGVGLRF